MRCFSRQYPQPGEALSGGRARGRGPGDDLHIRVVGVVALDLRICSTANRAPFQPDHLTERFGTFNCPRMSRTCCSAG